MTHKYLPKEETLLPYTYAAFEDWFESSDEFIAWYRGLASDQLRDVVLRVGPAYLALVKRGDWHVDMDGSVPIVEYFTNTYKCIGLISLVESLNGSEYIDFYRFLVQKTTGATFPLSREALDELYDRYLAEFGASRACIEFFKLLPQAKQIEMATKITLVKGEDTSSPSLEKVVRHLYKVRSNFAHRGAFVHDLGKLPTFTKVGNRSALIELSIDDLMKYFEEAFLIWCRRS